MVHEIEHYLLQNHTQSAGAHLPGHGLPRDGFQGLIAEFEAYILEFEQALVLLDNGGFRPGQDFDQGELIQILEHAHHRETAHELWNQTEFDQIFGLYIAQHLEIPLAVSGWSLLRFALFSSYLKAQRFLADAPSNDFLQAHKRSAANE